MRFFLWEKIYVVFKYEEASADRNMMLKLFDRMAVSDFESVDV